MRDDFTMKKLFFTLLLLIIILFSSCQNDKSIHLMIFNEDDKLFIKNFLLFKNYNIDFMDHESYLTINNITDDILIDLLSILNNKIKIIQDNITNSKTTRTTDGGPYLRRILYIDPESGPEIIKLDEVKYVYEPTHPDAIQVGNYRGYVLYPYIDLLLEYNNLFQTVQIFNSIVSYIHNNNINIMVEKINIISIDELKYLIRINDLLEFFIIHYYR